MAQGNSRSAASGRKSEAVSRKRHDLRLFAANRNAATVYPFLGYLRAKCRRFAAVALRNAPAGAVPRTPFLTVAENPPLYRQPQPAEALLPPVQRVEKVFSPRLASFQNFIKVLKT